VESQAHEEVVHVEKAASELVGPVRHDIWDVHCPESRWWVVTNPTNLYDQRDFKSRDVVLTFHIGLTLRLEYAREREVRLRSGRQSCFPAPGGAGSRRSRHWTAAEEAETFQAVWGPTAECLVSFIGETRNDDLVPAGQAARRLSDFKGWAELLANGLAPGESVAKLRSYLKETGGRNLGVR